MLGRNVRQSYGERHTETTTWKQVNVTCIHGHEKMQTNKKYRISGPSNGTRKSVAK